MATMYLDPGLGGPDGTPASVVELAGEEARHAIAVARVRVGERIAISDGRGLVVRGAVAAVDRDRLSLEVESIERSEPPTPALWLAQGLAKGDRDELAVQAATELGVAGVIPWAAERSVSRWEGPKASKGRERWAAIAREASKQSLRPFVPEVAALASTPELAKLPGQVVVLEPTADHALTALDLTGDRVTLVVGPEGGVSPRELESLQAAGAVLARLGPEVLRTSTAGPAAIAVLNARLGRW